MGKRIPIALQLYSVRDACKSDFEGTVREVARMGYDGVEFAGVYERSAETVGKMLKDLGLSCAGMHMGIASLQGAEFSATVEYGRRIGSRYLIVAWLPEDLRNTVERCRATAERFNEIAEKLRPEGMRVGFHAHAADFQPMEAGAIPWDILFDNTRPEVIMQADTGNMLAAGADPLMYLKRYAGRSATVHLKEYPYDTGKPVGEGTVPWNEVFALCETVGGTEWYVVEQEKYEDTPLRTVEKCLKNLRAMGR